MMPFPASTVQYTAEAWYALSELSLPNVIAHATYFGGNKYGVNLGQ